MKTRHAFGYPLPFGALLGAVLILSGGLPWLHSVGLAAGLNGPAPSEGYYAKRGNWTDYNGDRLNISNFVFRDVNRNGRYDLGDRAISNVLVEMTRPDGVKSHTVSNLNGFANFVMSATREDADIRTAGTYRFRIIPPPGWSVTSGNASQSMTFKVMPGAYADIIALDPAKPIGVAQDLTISGTVMERDAGGALQPAHAAEVALIGPDGDRRSVAIAGNGSFSLPAGPGNWTIIVRRDGIEQNKVRPVAVGNAPVVLSAIVVDDPPDPHKNREIPIDFESIALGELSKIPSGLAGLDWDNMVVSEFMFYSAEGLVNGTTSGHFAAYNGSGHPVSLSHADGFDFVGGYFTAAWPRAEGEQLVVRAYRDGVLVGAESIELSSFGPVWFDADYRDIDRLVLGGKHYWQFVADDFVVRLSDEKSNF